MSDAARLLAGAPSADLASAANVAERAEHVLRPHRAFARLDDVAAWLAAWQRTAHPAVEYPAACVFVADHGVTVEGVSAYPADVTGAMLGALSGGVATTAVLARMLGVRLEVVDVGVGEPTANLATEAALDPEGFDRCFAAGRAAVADLDCDILVLGEMGIGNTTAAAAVCAALFGLTPEDWTGRGTGIDEATLERKVAVVRGAQARLKDAAPMEVLRCVGGAELVAMAGAAVEARSRSIPILLDGFVVTAALAPLEVMVPGALDNCIAGHCSSEPGHKLLLEKLGKQPLLDLDLRLGEGSGALLALPLVKAAAACVTEVATFEEWGLTGPR
ncbi:MAG TPA: nicotinate-nucleotide--dimethylbenzimidazole phosphoribosyltransferase [Actinomycetota bacterium]|nr:nicotinate-nucleotide--dimethylbenzimidazole phosphoribosyltransferase [Actinomycetota bacterium]